MEDNPGGQDMTPLNLTAAAKKKKISPEQRVCTPRVKFHGAPLQELLHALSKNLFELFSLYHPGLVKKTVIACFEVHKKRKGKVHGDKLLQIVA